MNIDTSPSDSPMIRRLPFIEGDALTAAIQGAQVIVADDGDALEVVHGHALAESCINSGDQRGVRILEVAIDRESDASRLESLIARVKGSAPKTPPLEVQTACLKNRVKSVETQSKRSVS